MDRDKGQKIYKGIMLVVITALITAILTTIFVYKKLTGTMDFKHIVANNNSGIELKLANIRSMLEAKYVGELDDEIMVESAIKGYVAGVGDEYTEYYTQKEMNNQLDTALGNYVGIGIYMLVDKEKGQIIVAKPMENSPAEEAGIEDGDIIVKVGEEDVNTENVSDMADKIKGEAETKIKLGILRGDKNFEVEVERKRIIVSHINARMIEDNIGYINIIDFDGGAAEEFKTKYQELEKKGAKSLIIDIRGNGGGVVDEAIDILNMLCEKDSILMVTVDKQQKETVTKATSGQTIKVPVVVLTNGYSASAAEILAGALKDNDRAKIVGEKTYGKGVIQTLYTLTDGSGLKMTTEEYYTPSNNKINKVGIEPDYKVELPSNIDTLTDENDVQLKKAIELLK